MFNNHTEQVYLSKIIQNSEKFRQYCLNFSLFWIILLEYMLTYEAFTY